MTEQTGSEIGVAPPAAPAPGSDDLVEIVASRLPEGHGFHFKVRSNGRLYRLDAARDRQEPRFWCLRIWRCVRGRDVDAAELPWYGGGRMTRDEIPGAIAAIRAAPADWLALPHLQALRDWVLEDDAMPLATPSRSRPV